MPKSTDWARANPEKHRESGRKSYQKNREARLAKAARWRAANPEKVVSNSRKHRFMKYGTTEEVYRLNLEAQGGSCAICQVPFTSTPHIDHNHQTQVLRGVLCSNCNTGLGKFQDNPTILRLAALYLENPPWTPA